MMKFLRSQSQTVLIVVLAVIGFGFLFYGNAGNLLTNQAGHVHTDFGRIDGEDLSVAQLYEAVRNARDLFIIQGHAQELNQPGMGAELAQEAWRQLLLLHEADRLHIEISDKQLVDFIQGLPNFQKNGVYSPETFQTEMTNLQNNFHINPDMFESLLRNSLRLDAVRTALLSSVHASTQDISTQYEKYYGPAQVSLVNFDAKSFVNSAQVTPEEIAVEYKDHPDNPAYRTKEKRKVNYVLYELTPEQAKLPEKDKKAAIDALGEKALEFALSLQPDPSVTANNAPPADFMSGAKKLGLTPLTTDFFTVEAPPDGVPPSPAFNNATFALTKENPVSKVVELENGVAVIHLAEIQPSDLRPLEEVKPEIVKTLQQSKGAQAQQIAAQNAAQALKAALGKGTDFKTAATTLNLKVETLPAFVPMETSEKDPRLRPIAYVVTALPVGGISEPVPVQSDNSTLIVHLDGRTKADPAKMTQFEDRYRQGQEGRLLQSVYTDWAEWRSKRPGTHKPPDLDQYGSVE
jgi:peptidyl-prolyl cis-trans isomerase D